MLSSLRSRLSSFYRLAYSDRHLFKTDVIGSGLLLAAGDLMCQTMEKRALGVRPEQPYDMARTGEE